MNKEKVKEQLETLEEMVEEDLSNGRAVQRKLREKITKKGKNPYTIAQELELLRKES